ncbi:hypothetical protein E6C67_06800 [Azospirillum sp. TSA2s]|nr:hypothetical protein E6C67_06800 [Azospirillum sp. TSA2s]
MELVESRAPDTLPQVALAPSRGGLWHAHNHGRHQASGTKGTLRHPREGGDPGNFAAERLKRLDSRLRGNDGQISVMFPVH